jgi:squalene-hopene/tetraprenyl-beta-curcumene cyclase
MLRTTVTVMIALAATGMLLAGCGKDETTPPPATRPAASAPAKADTGAIDAEHLATVGKDVNEGVAWLLAGRNADGGWGFVPGRSHPGLTAMAVKVLLQHDDYGIDSPAVAGAFKLILKYRQSDGGFYDPAEGNANYVTAIVVMALATAKDPRQADALAGAVKFLRGLQIVPGSKTPDGDVVTDKHPYAGGVGYGKHGRPDLPNLGFWMEAMHETGVDGDDEAMQRAVAFVKRLQNRTEDSAEGQAFVFRGEDDNGFIYAIGKKDGKFVAESKAGESRRGFRSYGSMTYTGFKSMLYANVSRSDPRVQGAYGWIRKYWRLDSNPNMPELPSKQGLYYYYHVFAKALRAWGQDVITDTRDVKHNWRHELIDVLHARQADDGSWVNAEASRWQEGNPALATCYSLLALQETLKK